MVFYFRKVADNFGHANFHLQMPTVPMNVVSMISRKSVVDSVSDVFREHFGSISALRFVMH